MCRCATSAQTLVDETLAYRPLGRLPLVNVASRAYLDTFGMPHSLADLAGHHLVNYQPNPSGAPAAFEYLEGQTTRMLPMRHRITVTTARPNAPPAARASASCRCRVDHAPGRVARPDLSPW
jgi:hypothetical protein